VEAAASYRTLIEARPASAEARAALVSLGELQLSQLKSPGAALGSFEGYLTRDGSLTQEARYGRIRCLRALGREAEARHAIQEFVQRYPGSAQAKQLQQLSAQ
jgi:TolA-binding protein